MRFHLRNLALAAACIFIGTAALAAPTDHPSIKRPFQLPPSAQLDYAIKARQSGLMLTGNAVLNWQADASRFSLATETRAMLLGKILETRSEGGIDAYGLAPATATEKRLRRDTTNVTFDRASNTLRFSSSPESYPLKGGEQDRSSIIWQLAANARAAPKKFAAGSQWQYFVAGQQDAETWTFKVGKTEKIDTPLGALNAVRVTKLQPPGEHKQQLDLWLAPALEWYPVRVRHTEPDGDYIEQTLDKISKK